MVLYIKKMSFSYLTIFFIFLTCSVLKKSLYLSAKVFSTTVLIEDTEMSKQIL